MPSISAFFCLIDAAKLPERWRARLESMLAANDIAVPVRTLRIYPRLRHTIQIDDINGMITKRQRAALSLCLAANARHAYIYRLLVQNDVA